MFCVPVVDKLSGLLDCHFARFTLTCAIMAEKVLLSFVQVLIFCSYFVFVQATLRAYT